MVSFQAPKAIGLLQGRPFGAAGGEADMQVAWGRLFAPVSPGPAALTAQGNSYSFTLTDTNNLIAAEIEAKIALCAHYVIDLIGHYVSWQGTLDFTVNVRPGAESPYPQVDGILPSIAQIAWNGMGWDNQTLMEAKTGVDADPGTPDAGCTIYLAADGTIRNYGAPVWFDPNPQFGVGAVVPAGTHDFVGIYTHEIFHALGFYQSTVQWQNRLLTSDLPADYFSGPATNALYGGPLPFAGGSDHYGNTADPSIPISRGLMFQWGNYEGNRLDIGRIDLAVLADLGHTIKSYDGLALFEMIDTQPNLNGTAGNDLLYGDYHGNVLAGLGGGDVIVGGPGADVMRGGQGNDTMFVDSGADAIVELTGEGYDVVAASLSWTLTPGAHVELMTTGWIEGTAAINLAGNELDQQIWGNAAANIISGNGGDDTLFGFGGADTLLGNAGKDVFFGGAGANDSLYGGLGDDTYFADDAGDVIVENAGEGQDVAAASIDYVLGTGASIELMTTGFIGGVATLNLTGNELGNEIWGNDGINQLNGGAGNVTDALFGFGGNDALNGGAGLDLLVGGGGQDSFVFANALSSAEADIVADFSSADDTLLLDDAIFTGLGLGALNANAFVTGTTALDADDRILYDAATGKLYFDADGNGAGAAVQFALLSGNPAITANDFQVI